jgi:hypothetical protein
VRIGVPFLVHYARRTRRPFEGPWRPVGSASPSTSTAPPAGQFGGNGVPAGLDRPHAGPNRGLVGPVVGIETLELRAQPVPILGRARPAGNSIADLEIALTKAGGLGSAHRPAQHGGVVNDRRLGGRSWRRKRPLVTAILPTSRPLPAAFARATAARPVESFRALRLHFPRLLPQRHPVEGDVGVRVLEGLDDLLVERLAAHFQMRGRSE